MAKIGIIYKEEDKIIKGTTKKLISGLKKKYQVITDKNNFKQCQFIITLGGDGTILRASRYACEADSPILGIHLGGLGILTEINLEDFDYALSCIKAKKYSIDTRLMLEAEVIKGGRKAKSFVALNDIVIGKNEIARTIKIEARSNGTVLANYAADGLIVSTATGSTAYNFAVGGPILPPHSAQFIVSPICPHRSADRPIVMDRPITVEITKGNNVVLTADGQRTYAIHQGDRVNIRFSKKKTKFIRFKQYNLWGLLREKLGWG